MPKRARTRKTRRKPRRKPRTVTSWRAARPVLEAWRKKAASVKVELRRERLIDAVPIDFLRGEPVESSAMAASGRTAREFRGQLIFFTRDDVTIRRPSGAILVVDVYEMATLTDGRTRVALE